MITNFKIFENMPENLNISLKYVTDGLFDFLKESLPNVKFYISKKYNEFTGYYEYSIRYYKNNKAPDIDDIIRDNHSLTVIKIHKSKNNTVAIRIYPDKVGESLSRLDEDLYKYVMGIFDEVDWENVIDNERYKNFFTYKFETLKSLINKLNVDDYKMMKTANKFNI